MAASYTAAKTQRESRLGHFPLERLGEGDSSGFPVSSRKNPLPSPG